MAGAASVSTPARRPRRRFNAREVVLQPCLPTRHERFFSRLEERTAELGVNTAAITARVIEEIHDVLKEFGSSSARLCAASADPAVGPG